METIVELEGIYREYKLERDVNGNLHWVIYDHRADQGTTYSIGTFNDRMLKEFARQILVYLWRKNRPVHVGPEFIKTTKGQKTGLLKGIWNYFTKGPVAVLDTYSCYCSNCDKDTEHDYHSSGHVRDSSYDKKKCLVCQWTAWGSHDHEPPTGAASSK